MMDDGIEIHCRLVPQQRGLHLPLSNRPGLPVDRDPSMIHGGDDVHSEAAVGPGPLAGKGRRVGKSGCSVGNRGWLRGLACAVIAPKTG